MKEENHLMILMKTLNISGKELAVSIKTDITLISKYRHNKRRISYEVAQMIAEYTVYDHCSSSDMYMNLLKELLEPYSSRNIDICDDEELVRILTDYILEDTTEQIVYLKKNTEGYREAVMDIFIGNDGWKRVTEKFVENAGVREKKSSKADIIVGEFVFFDYGRPENYEMYAHASSIYTRLLENGHRIVLITAINEKYQSYDGLIKWLKLYAGENIEVYRAELPDTWDFNRAVTVEKNRQVFVNLDQHRDYEQDVYIHSDDESVVAYYYNMLREIKANSMPIVNKRKLFHNSGFTLNIIDMIVEGRILYILDTMPCYRNMPEDVFVQVLDENDITGAARESAMKRYRLWQSIYENNMCRCIFDIEEIKDGLSRDEIVDYELSYIVDREVHVRRELLMKHIEYILYENSWPDFRVANYSFSKLKLVYEYITMLVQGDNLLAMWSAKDSAVCIHYLDPSIIKGCRNYARDIWEELPEKCKSADAFMAKLK